jgi:hypothetical protein
MQLFQSKCIGEQLHSLKNVGYTKPLGDRIESFTEATGIKNIVESISQGLNIPCGCQQRKETLNKMFPGKNN